MVERPSPIDAGRRSVAATNLPLTHSKRKSAPEMLFDDYSFGWSSLMALNALLKANSSSDASRTSAVTPYLCDLLQA